MSGAILVLDSGIGGLSILFELKKTLSQYSYIYVADNGYFPYGDKSEEVIHQRVQSIVKHFTAKQKIDLIVIACNTASTIVLDQLRQITSIPVVGVVPAIKPAAKISKLKKLLLLATPKTIERKYIDFLKKEFAPDCEIIRLGSLDLVSLAEEKLKRGNIDIFKIERALASLNGDFDVCILGCTHFPFLRQEFETIFGANVKILDSTNAVVERCAFLLKDQRQNKAESANFFVYTKEEVLDERFREILKNHFLEYKVIEI